jgi:hypothetical protein
MTTQLPPFSMKHFDTVAVRFSSKKFVLKKKAKSVAFRAAGEEFDGECVSVLVFLQPA